MKPKSPVEEAYKDWWGQYPETGTWDSFDDKRWHGFRAGYHFAYEENVSETPQERGERVHKEMEELVRESVKWCEEHPDESVEDYLTPQERGDRIHKEVENEIEKLQEKNWYVAEENEWKTVALLFGKKLPVIPPYGYDELSPNAWYMWVVFNYDNYIKQRDIESGRYPTPPQTPKQIEKSLREAFKKVQQTEEWKETQRKIDAPKESWMNKSDEELVAMLEKNPPEFLKFELGKTLEELICKCMVDYNSIIPVGLLEDILNNIEKWLPDFQSHEGTQSASVIDLVDGYNDALTKIKSKLRNKK